MNALALFFHEPAPELPMLVKASDYLAALRLRGQSWANTLPELVFQTGPDRLHTISSTGFGQRATGKHGWSFSFPEFGIPQRKLPQRHRLFVYDAYLAILNEGTEPLR